MAFIPLNESASPRPRGVVPLTQDAGSGFVPLAKEDSGISETLAPAVKTVEAIGHVYPVAGLAGLGAAAQRLRRQKARHP